MPRDVRAEYPSGARAAALFWILFGGLGLFLGTCGGLVVLVGAGQAAQNNPNAGAIAGAMVCALGCIVVFYGAFLYAGIQTMRGTAKGLIGNGIGSLVFSLLPITSAVLTLSDLLPKRGGPNPNPEIETIQAVVMLIMGGGLLLAGILAISSNAAYQEWRAAEGLDRPRRRRDYDDDYDDRPRRRRRDEDNDDDDDDYDDRPRRRRNEDDDEDDRDRRNRRRDDD